MNCPKCGKNIKTPGRRCRYCGAPLSMPNERLSRRMTSDGRVATIGGLVILLMGVGVLIYGSTLFGAVLIGLGGAVAMIGRKMG